MSLGRIELAKYLAAASMSQTDLAEKINCSSQFVSEMLSGRRNPGRNTMLNIQRVTDGAVLVQAWFEPTPKPGVSK